MSDAIEPIEPIDTLRGHVQYALDYLLRLEVSRSNIAFSIEANLGRPMTDDEHDAVDRMIQGVTV